MFNFISCFISISFFFAHTVILFLVTHSDCQKFDYEFDMVKEEKDGQTVPVADKARQVDDYLYMKVIANLCVCVFAYIVILEYI